MRIISIYLFMLATALFFQNCSGDGVVDAGSGQSSSKVICEIKRDFGGVLSIAKELANVTEEQCLNWKPEVETPYFYGKYTYIYNSVESLVPVDYNEGILCRVYFIGEQATSLPINTVMNSNDCANLIPGEGALLNLTGHFVYLDGNEFMGLVKYRGQDNGTVPPLIQCSVGYKSNDVGAQEEIIIDNVAMTLAQCLSWDPKIERPGVLGTFTYYLGELTLIAKSIF